MPRPKYYDVNVTLTASTQIFYSDPAWGHVSAITYTKSTGTALSATADLTIAGETSGVSILSSLAVGSVTFTKYPRAKAVDSTNGAATWYCQIPVVDERIKITIAKATSTGQTGSFRIFMDGAPL